MNSFQTVTNLVRTRIIQADLTFIIYRYQHEGKGKDATLQSHFRK
ncbi:MAG: hypothetical protein PWQ06_1423 [Anaerophaga sp.]|nr:hypothetical protein [Anaerophaga sp.]